MSRGRRVAVLAAGAAMAVALPVTMHLAVDGYGRYAFEQQRLAALDRYARVAEANRLAMARYRDFLRQAEALVSQARQAGSDPESWDRYEVSLQRQLPFSELDALLAQADHGPDYYFKPATLDVRLPAKDSPSTPAAAADAAGADNPALILRGTFLVRRQQSR